MIWAPKVIKNEVEARRENCRQDVLDVAVPEIRRWKCAAERDAGIKAKARLEELIAGGRDVRLRRAQWKLDTRGRVLARLMIDGRDVAEIAIAEGWCP